MSRDPALDAFTRLSHSSPAVQLEAAKTLLNYFGRIQKEQNEDEQVNLGRRLVRGLACSKDAARRGFYLTFSGFLKIFSKMSYASVWGLAEKELKVSTASSKGEEGDLWLGRILFYGALVRSEVLQTASKEELSELVSGLMEAASKRSYLPQLAAPFLVHLIQNSTEEQFTKILWPAMKADLAKEWGQQTQHTLFLVLHIYKKFKGVKKTELKSLLGAQILSKPNWSHVAKIVLEGPHPVGPLVAQHLAPSESANFWKDNVQEVVSKASKAKGKAALDLLKGLVEASKDETLAGLLDASVVSFLKKSVMEGDLRTEAGDLMEALVVRVQAAPDTVRAEVLEALTTEDFNFDQVTKCGLVRAVASSLKADGLKMAADMCKRFVSDDQKKNKDKMGALQMAATLATTAAAPAEVRQALTIFLLEQAFFSSTAAGVLSQAAKSSFTRCLKNAPVPILKAAIDFVDKQLQKSKKPLKMDKMAVGAWKKMSAQVAKLEGKEGKVESVLAQLMVHLGLQLLVEPAPAIEALDELHECCDRILGGKRDKHWAEVVVEVLLSLLANPSAALRAIVRKVFSALCPIITQQALGSLVEACSNQDNILVPKDQAEEDDDSEEEEEEDEENLEEEEDEGGEDEEEEEEDDEIEDLDDIEETAVDRIRSAVRTALGNDAAISDTESVDVDDISEEEGRRLDEALSQAFKGVRKGLSKKESLEQQQIVHFRMRVLDLLETYISSEHSLRYTLDLAGPLLGLLERCLRDQPLRLLEGRIRHILTSFGTLRKFRDTSGVTEEDLVECLASILDHGQRTQAVFLAVASEAASVASFLGRAAQMIECSGTLVKAFRDAVQEFLSKRDCVLPATFFTPLLKTAWPGNLVLWELLAEAAFSDDEKIRPFRRPQALAFLQELSMNKQLKASHETEVLKLMGKVAENAAQALASTTLTLRFERVLLTMLCQVAPRLSEKQKESLADALRAHVPKVANAGKETKRAFRKLATMFKIPFNEQSVPKADVPAKEAVVMNGNGKPASGDKKKTKKQKKKEKKMAKKRNVKEEKIAKKAAKRLRLENASEGLEAVSFANVQLDNTDD